MNKKAVDKKPVRPEHYNPKAREALGRSLIDISGALYKGLFLLVTVVPASFILKNAFEGKDETFSIAALLSNISFFGYAFFLAYIWGTI